MKKIIFGIILITFYSNIFAQKLEFKNDINTKDTIFITDTIFKTDTIIKTDTNVVQIFDTITINKDSIAAQLLTLLDDIDYRINGTDCIKLYPTENIYNFLKLNTATGQIEQVQWYLDSDEEMIVSINKIDLSYDTGCGSFELYPTKNMYKFLLLDQVTDRVWHVQWGTSSDKRWIRRIY